MAQNQPTFEEALKQLETITQAIEQGRIGLEESIAQYEEGMKLVQYCRSVLEKAEQKIELLQRSAAGELKPTAFEQPTDEADSAS